MEKSAERRGDALLGVQKLWERRDQHPVVEEPDQPNVHVRSYGQFG